MPKLKTTKGAAKRFKLTKTGRIKRGRASANHLLTKKSTKCKRSLRRGGYVDRVDVKSVRKLMPYA
ncbi:MAG: 50S ribosomal protein L35 [Pseudomonadota bacterium]